MDLSDASSQIVFGYPKAAGRDRQKVGQEPAVDHVEIAAIPIAIDRSGRKAN
jgi:hypothetical protein